MSEHLRNRTVSGVRWSATSQVLTQGVTLAISVVLARLLGPKVYGLVGMSLVFTGFANVFGDLGLGSALVQRKELEARHLDAAFWANVFVGSFMTLLMAALGPVVARFYSEPALAPLTAVIALNFVISSLTVVQISLLQRNMQFRRLAKIQVAGTVASGLLGLCLAAAGLGPWSLVIQTLSSSLFTGVLAWWFGGWRPRLSFDFRAFKELFGFSAYVLGFNIVNYWARTLDQLLIGKLGGAAALGIYSRAYSLMLMPLSQVSRVVGKVMFPALSSIQHDKERVKRGYLKAITMIGFITFPMMTGAFVVSDHAILCLLGERWVGTIPIFKVFCWVGMAQAIGTTVGWVLTSQGRSGLYMALGVINSVICAVAFFIGVHWGAIGVAWSYLLVTMLLEPVFWAIAGRLIDLTLTEMLQSLAPPLAAALVMGAVVWGLGRILPVGLLHWQYVAIEIPVGVLLYLGIAVYSRLDAGREVHRVLFEMIRQKRAA